MPSRPSSARSHAAAVRLKREAYLAALPPVARRTLRQVRSIIRVVAPAAVEHFSYGIPGFTLEGQPLVWYAAFAKHFSLYPMGAAIRRTYAAELQGYPTSAGTIRFPLDQPVPSALVTRLVKARAAEARSAAKKKALR